MFIKKDFKNIMCVLVNVSNGELKRHESHGLVSFARTVYAFPVDKADYRLSASVTGQAYSCLRHYTVP